MSERLTEHQKKVLATFDKKNTDIDIAVLYTRIYGDPGHISAREMQQKLAPTFKVINEKLAKGSIEPGDTKRTYRFNTIGD